MKTKQNTSLYYARPPQLYRCPLSGKLMEGKAEIRFTIETVEETSTHFFCISRTCNGSVRSQFWSRGDHFFSGQSPPLPHFKEALKFEWFASKSFIGRANRKVEVLQRPWRTSARNCRGRPDISLIRRWRARRYSYSDGARDSTKDTAGETASENVFLQWNSARVHAVTTRAANFSKREEQSCSH